MQRRWTIELPCCRVPVLVVGCLFSTLTQAQEPWDGPSFWADPTAILRAAEAMPAGAGVDAIILLQEERFVYDDRGRATQTRRVVTKIVTKKGAENWSRTQVRWEGWHQDRPVLKARVITADGQVHELDPATISEVSANPGVPGIFSDVRELQAPFLPAIAPGCITEEESVTRDTAPFYDRGVVTTVRFFFGKAYPAKRARLLLESPVSLPLRYAVVGLGEMQPKREETRGQLRPDIRIRSIRERNRF